MEPDDQISDLPAAITEHEFLAQLGVIYQSALMLSILKPRQLKAEVARLTYEIDNLRGRAMRGDSPMNVFDVHEAIDRLRDSIAFYARLNRYNTPAAWRPRRRRTC